VGALIKATTGSAENIRECVNNPNFMAAHNRLSGMIGLVPVPIWNDGVFPGIAAAKDKDHVISVLRQAAGNT
jgi:hypothetical protein